MIKCHLLSVLLALINTTRLAAQWSECTVGVQREWVVESTAGATALAAAINCSGGVFEVEWKEKVDVNETIYVVDGTSLNVTGQDGAVADGGGLIGLFTVIGASLYLDGLNVKNGFHENGGAITATNSVVTFRRVVFDSNSANGGYGGALYANASSVSWSGETTFTENYGIYGGALYAYNSNVSWSGETKFTSNAGINGGALNVDASVVSWSGDTAFTDSDANANGGALYVSDNSDVSWSGKTVFAGNAAEFGGAAYVDDNSSVSWTEETKFIDNLAITGGALLLRTGNVFWTGKTEIARNTVTLSGGALYMEDGSNASWSGETVFADNTAVFRGGALYIEQSSVWWDGDTEFTNHTSESGGALYLFENARVGWTGATNFTANSAALDGGALGTSASGQTWLTIEGLTGFVNNTCGANGGAMALMNGAIVTLGGAEITFSGNFADVAGGAVSASNVIVGPKFVGASFVGNSAQLGGAVYALTSGTTVIGLEEYPSTFDGCEFSDNVAEASGGAIESASGKDLMINTSFMGNSARVGGALRLAGTATLSNCSFVDNASNEGEGPAVSNLGVIALMANCSFATNTFWCSENTFLDFIEGNRFEVVCDGCGNPEGSVVDNDQTVPVCSDVLEHSSSTSGDTTLETLVLDPGYWRATTTSRKILACYNSAACLGGLTTGDPSYCESGYEGPYCSVCSDGYAETLVYTCNKCSGGNAGVVISVLVVTIAVLIGVVFAGYMVSRDLDTSRCKLVGRLAHLLPRQSLKIAIVAWQILTQFTSVANVTYPDVYQRFLDTVDVLNFDLGWMFSAACVVDFDFHDKLLVSTLGPVVFMCLLGATYAVAVRRNSGSEDALEKVRHRHVSMVILLTFLIYSSVSSKVFQMFACDRPGDGKVYLRADYRIECDSAKHEMLRIYAAFMIAVYPVGIPFFYAALLIRSRDVLVDGGRREVDTRVQFFSDLWDPYKPGRFYYEVLECGRRIMLTGVVVFIFPDTAAQVAITIVIAVGFTLVSEALNPYESRWDAWVSRTGHVIVLLSIYVALLLKVDVSEERDESQRVFAVVLVVAHASMVFMVVVEAVTLTFSLKHKEEAEAWPRPRNKGVGSFNSVAPSGDFAGLELS